MDKTGLTMTLLSVAGIFLVFTGPMCVHGNEREQPKEHLKKRSGGRGGSAVNQDLSMRNLEKFKAMEKLKQMSDFNDFLLINRETRQLMQRRLDEADLPVDEQVWTKLQMGDKKQGEAEAKAVFASWKETRDLPIFPFQRNLWNLRHAAKASLDRKYEHGRKHVISKRSPLLPGGKSKADDKVAPAQRLSQNLHEKLQQRISSFRENEVYNEECEAIFSAIQGFISSQHDLDMMSDEELKNILMPVTISTDYNIKDPDDVKRESCDIADYTFERIAEKYMAPSTEVAQEMWNSSTQQLTNLADQYESNLEILGDLPDENGLPYKETAEFKSAQSLVNLIRELETAGAFTVNQ